MKRITIFFFALVLSITAFGQVPDSSATGNNTQLEVLNRQFSYLKRNISLSELESSLEIKLNTIGGCLMILDFAKDLSLDSLSRTALKERLEEMADTFVAEGTPILLSGNGMNSVHNAARENTQPNSYNLKYVSTGNSCISDYGTSKDSGVSAFNRRTLDKLELKYAPGVKDNHSKSRKRKKKNAA